jgi:hypothetical protein
MVLGFDDIPISLFTKKPTTLSKVIKYFKSIMTIEVKKHMHGETSFSATKFSKNNVLWQKSFYDHIIHNEQDLARIRQYILDNPLEWELDSLHPDNWK